MKTIKQELKKAVTVLDLPKDKKKEIARLISKSFEAVEKKTFYEKRIIKDVANEISFKAIDVLHKEITELLYNNDIITEFDDNAMWLTEEIVKAYFKRMTRTN